MTLPYQSSSDEESEESEGSTSLPQSKLSYREGIGVGEEAGPAKRSRPQGRPTAPPPSQKLLLQHQQSRKRATELQLRYKKRVSWGYLSLFRIDLYFFLVATDFPTETPVWGNCL